MVLLNSTLEFAKEYLENHLSVIPLKPRRKIPLLGSWEPYQTIQASNEQIEIWFSNGHAENNIAIVTGKISRIIAFDIDGEEGSVCFNRAVESLGDKALEIALKYTLCIKTGSGNTNIVIGFKQEEFASENDKITNSVLWRSKDGNANHNEIRLKGEGGYIVAPPSIHPNGNRYEVINGSIAAIPAFSKIQIHKLISAIKNQTPPKNGHEVKLNEEDVYEIVAILKPHYRNGNRNDFTMYLSGLMRKEGIPFERALKVIESIAADDEEKPARIRTLEETYKKQDLDKVCGYSVEQNHEGILDKTTGDISSTGDIISPADKIPPVEDHQNHAQKSATGDTGGIGDILSSSGETHENVASIKQSMFNCYYCDCFQTSNEKEYQRHIVMRHPGKSAYPSKIDLEKEGLN